MACVTLHNLMRIRYRYLQNQFLDREGEDHNIICGAWRDEGVLADLAGMTGVYVALGLTVKTVPYYNNI